MDLTCNKDAMYRYTWPGRDEALICEVHSQVLLKVAKAMGFYLQLIPLDKVGSCEQKIG